MGADKRRPIVDNSGKSGIIENERHKAFTNRKINAQGFQIIDKPTFNKVTKDFIKNGGLIIRGEDAKKHLGDRAFASFLPSLNTAFIRDDATVSDVLEEMYHAKQEHKGMYGSILTPEVLLKREINAQNYLLSLTDRYKIPAEEVEITKHNLMLYENELKKLTQGVAYDE